MLRSLIRTTAGRSFRGLGISPRGKRLPLVQLADRLRQGSKCPLEQLALCLSLGLIRRARDLADDIGDGLMPPADKMRLLILEGDALQAVELAYGLAQKGAQSAAGGEPWAGELAYLVAPLDSSVAIKLLEMAYEIPDCAVAIAQHAGADSLARLFSQVAGFRKSPDRWLVHANQRSLTNDRLSDLNAYLREFGLSPVGLLDPSRSLTVTNLVLSEHRCGAVIDGPLLSVILTAWNAEEYIAEAMCSVLQQTYRNLELIVLDDASSDSTWSIVGEMAEADERVIALRLPQNVGTYAAKNIGLAMARGEFAAFHDADDWSHPEKYGRCITELIGHPKRVAVTSCYVRLSPAGFFMAQKLWPFTRWTPSSVVFRRSPVLDRIGWLDDVRTGADSEFVARLRLSFPDGSYIKLRQPLMICAYRDESLMTSKSTGLNAYGYSAERIFYQNAWTEWHLAQLQAGKALYLPRPHLPRLFPSVA